MRRRFVIPVLVLCLAVAGCTGRAVRPPEAVTPAPVAAPAERLPRIFAAKVRMSLDAMGGTFFERALAPGDSFIPDSGCTVEITFAPSPPAVWYQAVRLDGAVPKYQEAETYRSVLQFQVPAGDPGSVATLTLPPLDGAAQTVYRLKRTERPTARLEVKLGGQWQAADPFRTYPEQDLTLRYAFTAPMDRESVEASLRQEVFGHRLPPSEGAVLSWLDDQTLVLSFKKAPPVVALSVLWATDQRGLSLAGPVPGIHSGPAPYLAAVNPATGTERRVRELVPEGFYAEATRDGQVLLLDAYELRPGQYGDLRTWLYDLAAGTSRQTEYLFGGVLIPATGEVRSFNYEGQLPAGYGRGPISPDGGLRLFVRPPKENLTGGVIAEVTLEIGRADGGERRVLYDGAGVRMGRFERGPAMAWAPDGKRIIFTSAVDEKTADLMVLDLATGAVHKAGSVPAFYSWYVPGPTMQWVGSRVLAGESVADLKTGKVLRTFPGAWATRRLSPDGKYVVLGTFDEAAGDSRAWGPVTILSVDSGVKVAAGEGLPAGWSESGEALIVRWDGWRHRFAPPGM
ncbi:MAG TPA: hypothetical protein VNT75_30025 [Symbiobacteriaceae bacterium]|nr:hypothetical protein [Symbiobacteriaceae bacterium]